MRVATLYINIYNIYILYIYIIHTITVVYYQGTILVLSYLCLSIHLLLSLSLSTSFFLYIYLYRISFYPFIYIYRSGAIYNVLQRPLWMHYQTVFIWKPCPSAWALALLARNPNCYFYIGYRPVCRDSGEDIRSVHGRSKTPPCGLLGGTWSPGGLTVSKKVVKLTPPLTSLNSSKLFKRKLYITSGPTLLPTVGLCVLALINTKVKEWVREREIEGEGSSKQKHPGTWYKWLLFRECALLPPLSHTLY